MEAVTLVANHGHHDERWLIKKDNSTLCVGCAVEVLEDSGTTITKKKHTLSEFLSMCNSKPVEMYTVLTPDDPATIHFVSLLHGMVWYGDRGLATMATEAIVHMCSHLKSQDLVASLMNSLITKILQTKPGSPVVAGLSLVGHLCQNVSTLVQPLLLNQGEFLHYLVAGLDIEDEEVQATIMFTMCSVYGDANLSIDHHYPVSHAILLLLDNSESKQLITNTLGFLRKVIQNQSLLERLMNYAGKVSLPSVLKKILLQTSDTSIRIVVVQCLCQILIQNDMYAETLLQADMAEFLYETLATMDHLLIGSVFCCLLLLSSCSDFYSKCHSVYGLEAIMRALQHCIQANHVKVATKGFQMLGEILLKQPENIPVFSNVNALQQVFGLISSGLNLHHRSLTISASLAMTNSLRMHHLGNRVELEIIEKTIQACLLEIKHQLSLSSKPSTQESLLRSLVQLLDQTLRLTLQWQEKSSVEFTSGKSLEQFEGSLLHICDGICVPLVISNYESIKCGSVFASLFSVLTAVQQMKVQGVQQFCRKLVSASFLRIALDVKSSYRNVPRVESSVNSFLISVCDRLLNTQNCQLVMQTALPSSTGDIQDILSCLQEDNIDGVTSEQTVFLSLLYLAFCHGERMIEEGILFGVLETFLRNHADVASLPSHVVKYILLLHAVCHQSVQPSTASEGCALLIQGLNRLPDLSCVYTHNPAVLQWCFSTPVMTPSVTRNLVTLWLTSMKDKNGSDFSLIKEILGSNTRCIQVILEILTMVSEDIGEIVIVLLKDFLSTANITTETVDEIVNSLTDILQKIILHPQTVKGQLKLLLTLLCQVHLTSTQSSQSNIINLKLLYHVCKLFNQSGNHADIELQFHALNYLNLTLMQTIQQNVGSVLPMVLSNNHLFVMLEDWSKLECLPVYLSTTLTTIALLVQLFHKHKTQVEHRVCFDIQYLVRLVSGKQSVLVQASALHLWSAVLSTEFSSCFVSFVSDSERSLLPDRDVNLTIPTRHLQQLYILAQNVLIVQDNEILQCCAVSCLCHLMMYSKRDRTFRNHLIHQPWNLKLMELTLDWCIHKNSIPISTLYLLHTLHTFPHVAKFLKLKYKDKLVSMLEEVSGIESNTSPLYIDNMVLPRFLSHDMWCRDLKTTVDEVICLLKTDD